LDSVGAPNVYDKRFEIVISKIERERKKKRKRTFDDYSYSFPYPN